MSPRVRDAAGSPEALTCRTAGTATRKVGASCARSPPLPAPAWYFHVVLGTTVVNVALPAIEHTPGGGVADAQWVVDPYTPTFGALVLSGGHVSDRLGASVGHGIGAADFALSSAPCAMDRRPPQWGPLGGYEACEGWPSRRA